MLVGERMSYPVITVSPETPIAEAINLMSREHIRRLPVVGCKGQLVGIVTEQDLFRSLPSDATGLSVWEIHYLIATVKVEKIMTREVITVQEDIPIEEAARIMADSKKGGMPVMRGDKLVGIITETDLFRILLEMLGAREPGIRITAVVPNTPDELARLTEAIFEAGGNILAFSTFRGHSVANREVTMKVSSIDSQSLLKAIQPIVEDIVDIREG
jgi:acetoin utilization protein AcuB